MVSIRIWMLFWCAGMSVVVGDIKEEQKQLTTAIRQLQEEKSDVAMVEPLGQSIASDSPLYPIAIQTAAWIYIKNAEYSKAWKLTQRYAPPTEEESLALAIGHHQLTLWLAMESGQTELATQHFKALVKDLVSRDEMTVPEKRTLSEFLGGICGIAKVDPHPNAIPDEILDRAIELMQSHPSKTVADHFQTEFEQTREAAEHLVLALDRVAQQAESETRASLKQSKAEFEQCEQKQKQAHQAWDTEHQSLRRLHRDTEDAHKAERHAWRILTTTEEPGRPSKPSEPHEPRKPRGSKRDNKGKEESDWREYERDMATYRRKYQEFVQESKTYEARKQEWVERNEKRRQRLDAEYQQIQARYVKMKADEDAQQAVVKSLEQSKLEANQELRQSQILHRSIDAALNSKLDGVDKSAHRPSLFDVIDFHAEAERLLASVRHAAK
ncbi:MAG: hypothetical protein ACK5OB_05510 [Pirellula sp.]